ncbi:MAG: excinuclease ABC subunit UvrC [Dehalogenimonas sp.]
MPYIDEQVRQMPGSPGVYLMKDARGQIIYVGKAVNLKNRVRSYFRNIPKLDGKTKLLVTDVFDLEYFVTGSEQEALILELNLIKRHRPRYNIMLKDDKSYPYLHITAGEWPRLEVTRRYIEGEGRYFGPFTDSRSVREVLELLRRIFPFRSCTKKLKTVKRPCLEYDMGRCPAPCSGKLSVEEYRKSIEQITLFLEGRQETVVRRLRQEITAAADKMEFERAAQLRDRVFNIEQVIADQKIAIKARGELDAVAYSQDGDESFVMVFFIRGGKLIGREHFVLKRTREQPPEMVLSSFIGQFYSNAAHLPPLILLEALPGDHTVLEEWLTLRRGSRVKLVVPHRGPRIDLMDMVKNNARQGLEHHKLKRLLTGADDARVALAELAEILKLNAPPQRIEGYDISNIQGQLAVGSMVVFHDGKPESKHYRRFRIKTVEGANDVSMMKEVIGRRFNNAKDDNEDKWVLPDLILIDGGKGQLSAALEALIDKGVGDTAIIGLAKEREEIFLPRQSNPILLNERSAARHLLQRVRDEAHRFALGYHTNLRQKAAVGSALDAIPGIGPAKRRALIKHFISAAGVRAATIEELTAVKSITPQLARLIKESL